MYDSICDNQLFTNETRQTLKPRLTLVTINDLSFSDIIDLSSSMIASYCLGVGQQILLDAFIFLSVFEELSITTSFYDLI